MKNKQNFAFKHKDPNISILDYTIVDNKICFILINTIGRTWKVTADFNYLLNNFVWADTNSPCGFYTYSDGLDDREAVYNKIKENQREWEESPEGKRYAKYQREEEIKRLRGDYKITDYKITEIEHWFFK